MERAAVALHVHLNTVDNNQGLGIARDAVQTTDEHGGAILGSGRVGDGVDVAAKLVGNFIVNGHSKAVDVGCLACGVGGSCSVHGKELVAEHLDDDVLCIGTGLYGYLLRQELRSMDIECGSKRRYLDFESTVFAGHGRVAIIAQGSYLDTCQGLFGRQVDDGSLQFDGRVGGLLQLGAVGLFDLCLNLIVQLVVVLSIERARKTHRKCADGDSETAGLHKIEYCALHFHCLFDSSNSTSSFGFRIIEAMRRSRV